MESNTVYIVEYLEIDAEGDIIYEFYSGKAHEYLTVAKYELKNAIKQGYNAYLVKYERRNNERIT